MVHQCHKYDFVWWFRWAFIPIVVLQFSSGFLYGLEILPESIFNVAFLFLWVLWFGWSLTFLSIWGIVAPVLFLAAWVGGFCVAMNYLGYKGELLMAAIWFVGFVAVLWSVKGVVVIDR